MNNSVSYIAVDDSTFDLLALKQCAVQYSSLIHRGDFQSAEDALAAAKAVKPDLIFLDVDMPGMNGVEVLRRLRNEIPMAVFITALPEYALDGFELSAIDYILKPLTEERFKETAKRVFDFWQMKQQANAYAVLTEGDSLIFKEGHTQIKIPQHEIIYLEAMQDYTKVVTATKNYLTLTALSSFLQKLSGHKFLRVHRSYAVARHRISSMNSREITCGTIKIPVGKTYRSVIAALSL